jgi:hypothetical protein
LTLEFVLDDIAAVDFAASVKGFGENDQGEWVRF